MGLTLQQVLDMCLPRLSDKFSQEQIGTMFDFLDTPRGTAETLAAKFALDEETANDVMVAWAGATILQQEVTSHETRLWLKTSVGPPGRSVSMIDCGYILN